MSSILGDIDGLGPVSDVKGGACFCTSEQCNTAAVINGTLTEDNPTLPPAGVASTTTAAISTFTFVTLASYLLL